MTIRTPGNDKGFREFYLRHVAHSEGCGCAEHVLRGHLRPKPGDSLREIAAALKARWGSRPGRK